MTRINLVPPAELTDQHLMAEYRELPMVPAALRRALRTKSVPEVLSSIPKEFTLNVGHVRFFYNKLLYLDLRFESLVRELLNRGFNLDLTRKSGTQELPRVFFNHYEPDRRALLLIRSRIAEKIALKPGWYRKRNMIVPNLLREGWEFSFDAKKRKVNATHLDGGILPICKLPGKQDAEFGFAIAQALNANSESSLRTQNLEKLVLQLGKALTDTYETETATDKLKAFDLSSEAIKAFHKFKVSKRKRKVLPKVRG